MHQEHLAKSKLFEKHLRLVISKDFLESFMLMSVEKSLTESMTVDEV